MQICPKHCIGFSPDCEGFFYPQVNVDACIHCNLCEKVCPVYNQGEKRLPLQVFAAKNKCEEELLASSSGGLFIILAKMVLKEGGVVFGAKFDDNWDVVHSFTEDEKGLTAFMQSKYVQSRIGNSYIKAKHFLELGRRVLFTGTSCQISGLRNYLSKDYDNLLAVDVICHGVPSPMVWHRYVDEIKASILKSKRSHILPIARLFHEQNSVTNNHYTIKDISFRDKRLGWRRYSFVLTLAEATADSKQNQVKFSKMHKEDPYMRLFLHNYILRPSCYSCPAKEGRSQSDITIADFWKVEQFHPSFDDEKGVGLLIVNTEKGLHVIDTESLFLSQSLYQNVFISNPVYFNSVREPERRKECFRLIVNSKKPIASIAKKIEKEHIFSRLMRRVKSCLRLQY